MDAPQEVDFVNLLLIGGGITFLLALAVVVFVVFYQRKLLIERLRLHEVKQEQAHNQLLASIQGQEQERSRLAQDLHDEVGAMLSTVKLHFSHLAWPATEQQVTNQERPEVMVDQLLDQAIVKLREVSHNLVPAKMERFGLVRTLEEQFTTINKVNDLQVYFSENLNQRLDSTIEIHLYRIVMELLNNTLKHAEASQVEIDLKLENDLLHLHYKDNGKGMEQLPMELEMAEGIGLRNLYNRVAVLKAEIQIQTAKNQGMEVNIQLKDQKIVI